MEKGKKQAMPRRSWCVKKLMMPTIARQWPNKQTNNSIEHDRTCVVDTNKGEKEEVDINNEGGRKWTMNLTVTALTTRIMTARTLMGLLMVLTI